MSPNFKIISLCGLSKTFVVAIGGWLGVTDSWLTAANELTVDSASDEP
jgi:hypothetical protein